jgi:hypothetical protein
MIKKNERRSDTKTDKSILEQKNHPMKWEKWNKGLVEKLKK